MKRSVVIIGSGFGGLATACLLAKDGYQVTVLEKNNQLGGRAGQLQAQGFTWDTGPSWYLMPDVFERFFAELEERQEDYFQLQKLSPSYRVFFKDLHQSVDMTGDIEQDATTFESMEQGAGAALRAYVDRAAFTYGAAMDTFLYKNYDSFTDYLSWSLIKHAHMLHPTMNMDRYVRRSFRDARLQKILQYPLVFLGASPYNAPALYNLMSHVDFNQGVFYPQGGIYRLVEALVAIGRAHGVVYKMGEPVRSISVSGGRVSGAVSDGAHYGADIVVSDADIYHTEYALLAPEYRQYSERYWRQRTLAPSALLLYLGVDGRYESLQHHNLLFSRDWQANFAEIFDRPQLPNDPSLYVCAPSKSDPTVAPKGMENLFVLVPIPAGLRLETSTYEVYADRILKTIEHELHLPRLRQRIVYREMRTTPYFESYLNSYQGTGLGLAHTLRQTALLRPRNYSKKVSGLYYVGANVHPGIGLPVTLISAELVRRRLAQI